MMESEGSNNMRSNLRFSGGEGPTAGGQGSSSDGQPHVGPGLPLLPISEISQHWVTEEEDSGKAVQNIHMTLIVAVKWFRIACQELIILMPARTSSLCACKSFEIRTARIICSPKLDGSPAGGIGFLNR